MTAIQRLIETFINGNLADAKRLAKSKLHRKLREAYEEYTGCSFRTAAAVVDYLKGDITFDQYCDIKFDEEAKQ